VTRSAISRSPTPGWRRNRHLLFKMVVWRRVESSWRVADQLDGTLRCRAATSCWRISSPKPGSDGVAKNPRRPTASPPPSRHTLPAGYRVTSTLVLGGLHHEYGLKREAAWRRIEFLRTTSRSRKPEVAPICCFSCRRESWLRCRWFEYFYHAGVCDRGETRL